MRKVAVILAVFVAVIISCKKEDPKFCYQCSQKVTYRVSDTLPTHSVINTKEYCDQSYTDIKDLLEQNPGVQTKTYTSYQMTCVREE